MWICVCLNTYDETVCVWLVCCVWMSSESCKQFSHINNDRNQKRVHLQGGTCNHFVLGWCCAWGEMLAVSFTQQQRTVGPIGCPSTDIHSCEIEPATPWSTTTHILNFSSCNVFCGSVSSSGMRWWRNHSLGRFAWSFVESIRCGTAEEFIGEIVLMDGMYGVSYDEVPEKSTDSVNARRHNEQWTIDTNVGHERHNAPFKFLKGIPSPTKQQEQPAKQSTNPSRKARACAQ